MSTRSPLTYQTMHTNAPPDTLRTRIGIYLRSSLLRWRPRFPRLMRLMCCRASRSYLTGPCLLIDEENRAFFLNELDGFAANTGVVVLATTNHPEKLDPAILDRPSRFDRKYYFSLPAPRERLAYAFSWNQSLEPELRLAEVSLPKLV